MSQFENGIKLLISTKISQSVASLSTQNFKSSGKMPEMKIEKSTGEQET